MTRLLQERLPEAGRLAHESADHVGVVLGEHRRDRILLGREVEQREEVVLRPAEVRLLRHVDVRELVDERVHLEREVGERQRSSRSRASAAPRGRRDRRRRRRRRCRCPGPRARCRSVSVAEHIAKMKPPAATYSADPLRDRLLVLPDLREARGVRTLLVEGDLLLVPRGVVVGGVELAVLAGEVLVVEVEPVVLAQSPRPALPRPRSASYGMSA